MDAPEPLSRALRVTLEVVTDGWTRRSSVMAAGDQQHRRRSQNYSPLRGNSARVSVSTRAEVASDAVWVVFRDLEERIASVAGGHPLFLGQPYKVQTLPLAFFLRIFKINPTSSIVRPGQRSTGCVTLTESLPPTGSGRKGGSF